jgi:hypothetical protein
MPKKLNNILSIFVLLLSVCFALNSVLLSTHHSSHEISEFLEGALEESALESNHKALPKLHNLINYNKPSSVKLISDQIIFNQSKISLLVILIKNKLENFGHKFRSHQDSKSSDCDLCLLSMFQSQFLSLSLLTFLILLFFLVAIFFSYYETKKYFTSFNQARAPPLSHNLSLS